MEIRGLIFDLDGVLVTTDELHYRAWQRLADQEGIDFDHQVNERLRGIGRMESLSVLLERSERAYTDDEKLALADRKNAMYRGLLEGLSPADVLPGVRDLLGELRRLGTKLAVASSSKNARLILDRVRLAEAFDAVVDGNDVTHSKPHPEVFLLAAEQLGLSPRECVAIEDAPAGIEAGRRAGMAVFGIGTPEKLPGVSRSALGLDRVTADELVTVAM
ncbi:MAG: beta-phosphoglucomutase [Phycisphaerae bacterium]|nr:beta-phosphoglucomutase [Phycisphaerae bacterium]